MELDLPKEISLQNIKVTKITDKQLDEMIKLSGSVASLFSKRAMKYRSLGLNEKNLTEKEMREWILKEYTFLKRPVLVMNDQIFVGNSKKVVASAKAFLHG